MYQYVILVVGWSIYFFLHSALASEKVKNFATKFLKSAFRYYRLGYTAISTLGLIGLLTLNASLRSENLFDNTGIIRYVSLSLAAGGVVIIRTAFRQFSLSSFLGLIPEKSEELNVTGILGYVRHPIYSGTILIVLGFWLFTPDLASLISMLCIFFYLPVGICFEEKKLIRQFGIAYLEYRKTVPAIIPKLF